MTNAMVRRALVRMLNPSTDDSMETIRLQREVIDKQRAHIKALDERVATLELEAKGLRELLF